MASRCRALAGVVILLAPAGCCTLARLWCGPDRSPWISVSFETPDETVATLKEAIRRDRPLVIYQCLSEGFKRRLGVLTTTQATIAWEKIKEETPGVHLLGTATQSGPERLPDGRIGYVLTVAGRGIRVILVRQPFVESQYDDDGDVVPAGAYVRRLEERVTWSNGRFTVRPAPDAAPPPELAPTRIRRVVAGYDWKVDELERLEGP